MYDVALTLSVELLAAAQTVPSRGSAPFRLRIDTGRRPPTMNSSDTLTRQDYSSVQIPIFHPTI
jgi:hypothetical protein